MTQTRRERGSLLKRIILIGGVVSTASIILVACGGSDSRPADPVTATSYLEEKKQALAVPPGWKGRAPASEVINGITVPPEPAPTVNNSTLAGVDSNNNGVRDDVERMIAKKSTAGSDQFNNMMITARAYQGILLAANLTQEQYDVFLLQIICAGVRAFDAGTLDSLSSTEIRPATFNTVLRQNTYRERTINIHGRATNARKECK